MRDVWHQWRRLRTLGVPLRRPLWRLPLRLAAAGLLMGAEWLDRRVNGDVR